jgi:flavin reductase (DIM6/NTAB) family NADH-FMN oxidoreductase RutF
MQTDDFRRGMRRLAGAVTIVTAGKGEDAGGLTATAVCSLTAEPPRLLACLNSGGATFDILRRHGRFCVNLVGSGDRAAAEVFAGIGVAPGDRFAAGAWVRTTDRAPRLASALAAFECSVHSITMLATHGLVIGDVDAVHITGADDPLLYHEGRFARLAVPDIA